jgi:hypothetical protein
MRRTLTSVSLVSIVALVSGTAAAGPIEDLAPGEWYRVPNSHMGAVDPCPTRDCNYSAVEGIHGVIDDWSGGAFDTVRDRLLVWGGGHGGYGGNEIYAFDLNTLKWSRLTNPSDPVNKDVPYAPDGRPTSRHTYNYIQYVPSLDSLCSFGGAAFYETGQTGTEHTDCYDFTAQAWQHKADSLFHGIGAITAIDGDTGLVWGKGTGYSPSYEAATTLAQWNPTTNTFTARDQGNPDLSYAYYLTAAIDSKRHQMIAVGGGDGMLWQLSASGNVTRSPLGSSGATEIEGAEAPGLAYDSKSDRIIGWNGGANVYSLDPTTHVWSRLPPASTNAVTPTAANGNGTFGRFRYSSQKNVFVVVNSTDEDVYVYRLSAGAGVTTPLPSPTPTPSPSPSNDAAAPVADAGADATLPGPTTPGPADASSSPPAAEPTPLSIGCTTAPGSTRGEFVFGAGLGLALLGLGRRAKRRGKPR